MTTCETIRFIRSNYRFITSYANYQYVRGLIMMSSLQRTITFAQQEILLEEIQKELNKVIDSDKPAH